MGRAESHIIVHLGRYLAPLTPPHRTFGARWKAQRASSKAGETGPTAPTRPLRISGPPDFPEIRCSGCPVFRICGSPIPEIQCIVFRILGSSDMLVVRYSGFPIERPMVPILPGRYLLGILGHIVFLFGPPSDNLFSACIDSPSEFGTSK